MCSNVLGHLEGESFEVQGGLLRMICGFTGDVRGLYGVFWRFCKDFLVVLYFNIEIPGQPAGLVHRFRLAHESLTFGHVLGLLSSL
jgi:hypothetical protein